MIAAFTRRFEMRPGKHRAHPVRDGLILLTIVGTALFAGYTRHIPFTSEDGQIVRARVTSAANVQAGQPVRVQGVDVGKVEGVELDDGGSSALITMRIKPDSGVDVRRDARAGIWWRTLLGYNQYVEIEPGSPSAPSLGGDVIPLARTTVQTEVDEVLRTLDDDGRQAVRDVVAGLDGGLREPRVVRDVIDRAGPALTGVAGTVGPLRGTRAGSDLPRLVRGANRTFAGVAADEAALGGIVEHADTALAVTAARRADLGDAIAGAPAAMRETRATLTRLKQTLDVLDPLVADLEPGARVLRPAALSAGAALRDAVPLLERARPLLRSLQPALRGLGPVSRDTTRLISDLEPTVARANKDLIPWLHGRDDSTRLRNFEAIGPAFSTLADASSLFDTNGFSMRFQTAPAERALPAAPCLTSITNPDAKDKLDCTALTQALGVALGQRPPSGKHTVARKGRGR